MAPRPSSRSMIHGPSRVPIMSVAPAMGSTGQGAPAAPRYNDRETRRGVPGASPPCPPGAAPRRPGTPALAAPPHRKVVVKTALLLIAHGSREPEANADLDHVAAGLRGRGHEVVEPSFLELAEPDVEEGARRCVARGAGRVVLVPYFLSAGVHVRRDLTRARERLAQRFPGVEFRLAEPLGRHPLLVNIVAERAAEAEGER